MIIIFQVNSTVYPVEQAVTMIVYIAQPSVKRDSKFLEGFGNRRVVSNK
jgi:hypothetical protein